jgi:glucosamine 6-phosphate synthetase-like amidotransferase/phosphosugar isomerase protein
MCGVMGYVRTGEQTIMTWPVVKHTFAGIEARGKDASGFGAIGDEGRVVCRKNIPSTLMAQTKNFRRAFRTGDMVIGHARAATHGDPADNRNNHPFWTTDGRYVMVHNGIIYDNPEKLKIITECDSEIALRMIEKHGIREAFDRMSEWKHSSFAILVLDTQEHALYACRDDRRPLVFGNLQMELGGYILASTKAILHQAMHKAGVRLMTSRILETRPYSIYRFQPGISEIEPERLDKFYRWERNRKNKSKKQLTYGELWMYD